MTILTANTNKLAQTTLVIPGQFTFKHIYLLPEFLFIIIIGLYQASELKDFEDREYLFH
jgi:hypothetical protein